MTRAKRNPPHELTGPQGVTTMLAQFAEQSAALDRKLDQIIGQLDEVLDLVTPAMQVDGPAEEGEPVKVEPKPVATGTKVTKK